MSPATYEGIQDDHGQMTFIIYDGMLVRVGPAVINPRKTPVYGIVIECDYRGLGLTESDRWKVFSDGQIFLVPDNQIWPLEFFE